MFKALAIGAIWLAVAGSYGAVFWYGGEYRESKLKADQALADNQKLIKVAETMVNSFTQVQDGLRELAAVQDETIAGDAITFALDRVRNTRKPPVD